MMDVDFLITVSVWLQANVFHKTLKCLLSRRPDSNIKKKTKVKQPTRLRSFPSEILCHLFLSLSQMWTSARPSTTAAVSTSASTSQEITGAPATMASAWHMTDTTVSVSVWRATPRQLRACHLSGKNILLHVPLKSSLSRALANFDKVLALALFHGKNN